MGEESVTLRSVDRAEKAGLTEFGRSQSMRESLLTDGKSPTWDSNMGNMDQIRPGEYLLKILFAEFTSLAEKKIDQVLEPLEKPLNSLRRGEDVVFDRLLNAFGSVAEHCLPSILRTLIDWFERQLSASSDRIECRNLKICATDSQSKASGKYTAEAIEKFQQMFILEKRDLAVEFIFCLVLIEVLKQLSVHPGHEDLTGYIENVAFKHFKYRETSHLDPNLQNINIIADLYAEVIGVMVQSRFTSIWKRFAVELKELRSREASPLVTHNIISLLMGMKFFRVKMVPIEEFEASFLFINYCAAYYLDTKDKDIKHALAGLFVEILVPVAAVVKNYVNVPCLKNFVELLYPHTIELCTKKKHTLALFPLVTCLLCVSQKTYFLQNWGNFLGFCLSNLKNRDPKMSRVALESLYRLLWAYVIRIKCESNNITQARLQLVVNSLFPKGSKTVVPRDTPLNIFVKIIQFVAQERLDFAMKEIVFDLLSVGRPIKIILSPERMCIGLRAFLVVADSLQQKDPEPPMPRTLGVMPSGNTVRVKKTFLNKMLTDEVARSIGVDQYYPAVKKSLNDMLRALDTQLGRPLMMTSVQNINKEPDDMITAERKPRLDLFRTCIAAIPRLLPDGMNRHDLIELLLRLTLHMDEEMRALSFQSLQNIVNDFPEWREDIMDGFVMFILQEISDSFLTLLDSALRMLLQLLSAWKNAIQNPTPKEISQAFSVIHESDGEKPDACFTLHRIEGMSLVMLCHGRQPTRRLAAYILKEVRLLMNLLPLNRKDEPVAEVMDRVCPAVIENCIQSIPVGDRSIITSGCVNIDLLWLAERSGSCWVWTTQDADSSGSRSASQELLRDEYRLNAWSSCLMEFMGEVESYCPTATGLAWTIVSRRLNVLFDSPDLTNRASGLISRGSSAPVKSSNERDLTLKLWRSYLIFACRIAPTTHYSPHNKSFNSTDPNSSPDSTLGSNDRSVEERCIQNSAPVSPANLFMKTVQMGLRQDPRLRDGEQSGIRSSAIVGLSLVNKLAVKDLMDEMLPYIREAVDRKQENMRRRKQKDALRCHLSRLLELIAGRGTFAANPSILETEDGSLNSTLMEYISGMRSFLEAEADNDKDASNPSLFEVKHTFCRFVTKLIESFKRENRNNILGRDLRKNLFFMFANWAGVYGKSLFTRKRPNPYEDDVSPSIIEFSALNAMCSVLCCGPLFDPTLLAEDSHLYHWLESLITSREEAVSHLGQKTALNILHCNSDIGCVPHAEDVLKDPLPVPNRPLQMIKTLQVPINSRILSDILSRLVEAVSEQGEETEGYVTELILTLEAAVESMDSEKKMLSDLIRGLFKKSSLNPSCLRKSSCFLIYRTPGCGHFRRTYWMPAQPELETLPDHFLDPSDIKPGGLRKSKSVENLKTFYDQFLKTEDRMSLLSQFLWISIAMLETDYEQEFLMAVRLLDKILSKFPLDQSECIERAEKLYNQLKWPNFPGIHSLLLKGCTNATTFEPTVLLLQKVTPILEISLMDPSESADAFPFNLIALLPYLLANYDDPNDVCIQAAKNFAQWSSEKMPKKLEHLATIMTLYSRRSFSKDQFQWTKCVVKYLFDGYSHVFPSLVSFLVEVTDKGPSYISPHSMSVLYYIFHYVDINCWTINSDLNKIITRYIECSSWREALKIIKIVVTRSSTLAAAPAQRFSYPSSNFGSITGSTHFNPFSAFSGSTITIDCLSLTSSASFADSELSSRRELPGRILDFSFDVTQTPIVGRKYLVRKEDEHQMGETSVENKENSGEAANAPSDLPNDHLKNTSPDSKSKNSSESGDEATQIVSPKMSLSSYNQLFNDNISGYGENWKKPWLSQVRMRERLISVLSSFGQKFGLPKSPSVIFSQSGDAALDRQSLSVASSTEDISATNNNENNSGESKLEEGEFGHFKDFDFLEYELESQESESIDNFNWGVRMRSLTNLEPDTADDLISGSPSQDAPIGTGTPGNLEVDLSSDESLSPFDATSASVELQAAAAAVHLSSPSTDFFSSTEANNPKGNNRKRSVSEGRASSVLSCNSTHSQSDGELTE